MFLIILIIIAITISVLLKIAARRGLSLSDIKDLEEKESRKK